MRFPKWRGVEKPFILDAHTHIGASYLTCYFTDRRWTAEDLIREMDRCGVDMACVSGGGLPHEIKMMNERVLEAVTRYPNRLIGFVRLNPKFSDVLDDLDYYIRDRGFRGIKLHPNQDGYCLLKEPVLNLIFERAAKYRVPVLIHSGTEPWTVAGQFADQAEMFPDVTFIMAHSGLRNDKHVLESAKRVENLILETSIGGVTSPRILGKDRVVFGSDWPTTSMRSELQEVFDLWDSGHLSDEEALDILGLSMARILRINPRRVI
ncbi:MAG: amidohydrolase family protein [Candidatus Bathyarchaeia archaeon]|nr:amidohydrolase family protein [Candidatus Bathyarchaeota archaeon]